MKKLTLLIAALLVFTLFSACGSDDYEVVAGNKAEIQTSQIITETVDHSSELLGSWYFVGEDAHFMEFFDDGTAQCMHIPEIIYTYTYDGETLTLTTPDFTRTYPCKITEEGYLTYTWDDAGTPTTETCEKRDSE